MDFFTLGSKCGWNLKQARKEAIKGLAVTHIYCATRVM